MEPPALPLSCPAKAGHPVITENLVVTGSPAFAGDDDRDVYDPSKNQHVLMDRDSGVAQTLLLHQGEQDGGVGGMQPDAAARRRSAEPRDMRRAVDGEIAVVEDRIWHRRVVVEGRAVVARERLRAEGPARRAVDPGGDRPGIAVLAVDDHGHPLARLVDPDHDVGADVTRRRQQRHRDRKPGYAGKATHGILLPALDDHSSCVGHKMYYHHKG